ncbi:bile acid:sodium symporter family protein [Humibacillus xanthopallidus]|uniref:BASS family bile acid:Na+ symporter n=1 Tax=Humibacillus xanthopallidus TaxID=412689 RepID=A0A543HG71_9MICO|nr:bile acid:sodium symporter [Humibacillus xanthopallidus]TQM57335.1 BASS family bile acid:Na+ symporter [Humibacillus xanthopallidus]
MIVGALSIAFQLSVAATVFWAGLGATREDIGYVLRRPRLLFVSLVAMFVVMPVVALAIEVTFDLPHAARVALVVLALSPIPQLLPRTTLASGGHHAYAYGLAFAVSLLSIVIVPAMTALLGRIMSRPFGVDPGVIARTMVLTVLVPLALGYLVQRVAPRAAERLREPVGKAANLIMLLAVVALLVVAGPSLLKVASLATLGAMTLFVLIGLLVGHMLGGPVRDHAIVLAIACASRNPGLAIGIAAANFPTESFGATVILYAVLIGIVVKPYVSWQQRRLAAEAPSVTVRVE